MQHARGKWQRDFSLYQLELERGVYIPGDQGNPEVCLSQFILTKGREI